MYNAHLFTLRNNFVEGYAYNMSMTKDISFLVYQLYSSKKTEIDVSVGVSIVTSKREIFWIGSEHFVFTENKNSWQTYSSGAGTIPYLYRALVIIPNFWWDSLSLIFSFFLVLFHQSLFIFSLWSLYCLSFNLQPFITPLTSSNSSYPIMSCCKKSLKISKGGNQNPYIKGQTTQ